MSAVIRVKLNDDLRQAIDAADDNEAFALLNAAADYWVREQKEIPLDEALKTLRKIAAKIEALG